MIITKELLDEKRRLPDVSLLTQTCRVITRYQTALTCHVFSKENILTPGQF
jgi:hypothetical protein